MSVEPFRGSVAVAAGHVTPGQLRGPRYRRLYTDIHVRVLPADDPPDLELRSRAAHLLVAGRGVLGSWSAAELLGASCGPADADVEVVVPGGSQRPQRGLRVRRGALLPDEIVDVGGIRVTGPLRTAFDLACSRPLRQGIVAVDALARVGEFEPEDLFTLRNRHLGARGSGRLAETVRRADRRSGSPMETRIRLAIEDEGLPLPVLQHPVGPYSLDLSYPAVLLAVEHNGGDHLTAARALRDLEREAYLTRRGWRIIRFGAAQVYSHPVCSQRGSGKSWSSLGAPAGCRRPGSSS
jgi:very-short-patch-repair endonuclease